MQFRSIIPSRSEPTILLVGTREELRRIIVRGFELDEFRVVAAADGDGALKALRAGADSLSAVPPIDAVLLVAGAAPASVERFRAVDPALPIILVDDALTPARRLELRREFQPYGIVAAGDHARILELVQSAVFSARSLRRVLEAHELRSLVAGRLSEELYGLLQVIRGYAEVLSDAAPPAPQVVERLQTAAEASLDLAQSYIDLRRLDRASVSPRQESVDVDLLLEELGVLAKRRMGGRRFGLRARCRVRGASISTDGEKLHALLAHLLVHSIESGPPSGLCLDVEPGPAGGTLFRVGPRRGTIAPAARETSVAFAIAQRFARLIGAALSFDADEHRFVVQLPAPLRRREELEHEVLH